MNDSHPVPKQHHYRRAVCHVGGVTATTHKNRKHRFNYAGGPVQSNQVRTNRPSRSESELVGRDAIEPASGGEIITAFCDDGRLGAAVLPPDWKL